MLTNEKLLHQIARKKQHLFQQVRAQSKTSIKLGNIQKIQMQIYFNACF